MSRGARPPRQAGNLQRLRTAESVPRSLLQCATSSAPPREPTSPAMSRTPRGRSLDRPRGLRSARQASRAASAQSHTCACRLRPLGRRRRSRAPQVGVDDPGQRRGREPKVHADERQGDVDDRRVEHDQSTRPCTAGQGQAIGCSPVSSAASLVQSSFVRTIAPRPLDATEGFSL
jgi:hypothetical protein